MIDRWLLSHLRTCEALWSRHQKLHQENTQTPACKLKARSSGHGVLPQSGTREEGKEEGGRRRRSQLWSAGTQRDKAAGKILKGRCGCSNVLTNSRKFPLNPVCWLFCSCGRRRERSRRRSRRSGKKESGLLA